MTATIKFPKISAAETATQAQPASDLAQLTARRATIKEAQESITASRANLEGLRTSLTEEMLDRWVVVDDRTGMVAVNATEGRRSILRFAPLNAAVCNGPTLETWGAEMVGDANWQMVEQIAKRFERELRSPVNPRRLHSAINRNIGRLKGCEAELVRITAEVDVEELALLRAERAEMLAALREAYLSLECREGTARVTACVSAAIAKLEG